VNGPSPLFLANVAGAMSVDPNMSAAPPPQTVVASSEQVPAGPPPAPPPPAPVPWAPTDPLASAPKGVMAGYDPLADPNPRATPSPPVDPAGPPPAASPSPAGPPGGESFPLVASGGGGMTKAFERETRGPSLLAAQQGVSQGGAELVGRVGERDAAAAENEYMTALETERSARDREAAMQQSVLERQDEAAERQADFDTTARQLSKQGQLDRGRFWASRSTPQKVAGVIELMLAGFRGAPSMLQKRIDDDVKAQEFAFYATRDTAQAKQTAFQMAMQKYQNADAARAMARVAALDVTQAQLAQVSAKWKGTEAANKADMALESLQREKMGWIAQGIQFVPSQYRGRMFMDPRTGLTYSESEAKALDKQMVERNFERQKISAGDAGKIELAHMNNDAAMQREQIQAGAKQAASTRGLSVQLPGGTLPNGTPVPGETVMAPSEKEAEALRKIVASRNAIDSHVQEALQIRQDASWMLSPTKGARLNALEKAVDLESKNLHELGVIAGPDMGFLEGIRGSFTGLKPGTEDAIRRVPTVADTKIRAHTKTYADATPAAKGQLSKEEAEDLKVYGGKK
jgi:hypothetical protein